MDTDIRELQDELDKARKERDALKAENEEMQVHINDMCSECVSAPDHCDGCPVEKYNEERITGRGG